MLLLAVAGLVLMHGLDVHGVEPGGHVSGESTAEGTAIGLDVDVRDDHAVTTGPTAAPAHGVEPTALTPAEGFTGSGQGHGGQETTGTGGMVMIALCIAVLVAAVVWALHPAASRHRLRARTPTPRIARPTGRAAMSRPPGLGRLELCIQIC